jgi:hypothetical protein
MQVRGCLKAAPVSAHKRKPALLQKGIRAFKARDKHVLKTNTGFSVHAWGWLLSLVRYKGSDAFLYISMGHFVIPNLSASGTWPLYVLSELCF